MQAFRLNKTSPFTSKCHQKLIAFDSGDHPWTKVSAFWFLGIHTGPLQVNQILNVNIIVYVYLKAFCGLPNFSQCERFQVMIVSTLGFGYFPNSLITLSGR
jgi:hypothetical protein